jgi:anaerobic ribonucleoside-triphosphate reductase activating protein
VFVLWDGDGFKEDLIEIAKFVKSKNLKTAVYSGDDILYDPYIEVMDYYKLGSYQEEFGPLNNEKTNQILYKIENGELNNITYRFWRKHEEI